MRTIRYFWLSLLAASLFLAAGCDDDKDPTVDPVEDELEVDRPEIIFDYDQLTAETVKVTTNVKGGYRLDISQGDWLDVDQKDGEFSIKPKTENESLEEQRRATITVRAGTVEEKTVTVRQRTRTVSGSFEVSPREITYEYQESLAAKRVDVTADVQDGYRLNNTAPNWIEIDQQEDHFTVVPRSVWEKYSDRSANLHVMAGDETIPVSVTQKGSGIVAFEFENLSSFDPGRMPWNGTTDGSFKYAETDATTYDKDYTVSVVRNAGFDESNFKAELDWGNPSLGEDVDKRYLRISMGKNRSSSPRTATVTITATEDATKSQTISFSQEEVSLDPIEIIAAETWHIFYNERYEDLVPGFRRFTGGKDFNGQLTYDRDQQLLYLHQQSATLFDIREVMLRIDGTEIYAAHNQPAGFFNFTTTATQWVVAIIPGELPEDEILVWDVPSPAQARWEYDLNAAEPYLRALPLFFNGTEHKLALLVRNVWDETAWEDYDPDDPLEIRNPNNYCWGLFTDFYYTLIED